MGIFSSAKQRHAEELVEQAYYETAAAELASGDFNKGIYAKSISLSDGDQSKVEPIYIKLRVNSLKLEIAAVNEIVTNFENSKESQQVTENSAVIEETDKDATVEDVMYTFSIVIIGIAVSALVIFLVLR